MGVSPSRRWHVQSTIGLYICAEHSFTTNHHAMPQSHVVLYCHIVFATKGREHVLVGDVGTRLHGYTAGIINNVRCLPIAVGGFTDHMHMLVQVNPKVTVPVMVGKIKANTSRWIHETFPSMKDFAWQDGYAAFSISKTHVNAVAAYIQRQEEHHRGQSHDEEMARPLR